MAAAAHDLGNILTVILSDVEALERNPSDTSQASLLMERLSKCAGHAREVCLALQNDGRLAAHDVSIVEMGELVSESLKMLGDLSARAHVRVHNMHGHGRVRGVAAGIRRVILNLVTNAIESLGDRGGEVVLSVRKQDSLDADTMPCDELGVIFQQRPFVCLEVADNGCGMTADEQRHIFDPFFTTKTTGRGLGLASTATIIRDHGGAIVVKSEPRRGTVIRVFIPEVSYVPGAEGFSR
jgi:two-component system cell cycle sensor histidine kinase/response regulator CckA